jgi:cyanophycinase-like exopeptidase
MKNALPLFLHLLLPLSSPGQNFTSYFTGNIADATPAPLGGTCLMGGATEDDNAMKWFLQRANGGDVLVLRASGADGYNDYLYAELGIPVNSVETIVCHNATASSEPYLRQKIAQAEAIWLAGGNQWNYVSYWRNSPVDSLINLAIQQRNVAIGGTSAGMAVLGGFYFSAQYGTVTAAAALANPYDSKVTVDSAAFLISPFLDGLITDTHFDNPDRKGRLTVFLSRIFSDYGLPAKAIACDEYTAVCIEPDGMARVFGQFPDYDDNAYFVRTNCTLANQAPEVCSPAVPLTWQLGGQALVACQMKGTADGSNHFNLQDWTAGTGAAWLYWSAAAGVFSEQNGTAPDCSPVAAEATAPPAELSVHPNPAAGLFTLAGGGFNPGSCSFRLFSSLGRQVPVKLTQATADSARLDMAGCPPGIYFLQVDNLKGRQVLRIVVQGQ